MPLSRRWVELVSNPPRHAPFLSSPTSVTTIAYDGLGEPVETIDLRAVWGIATRSPWDRSSWTMEEADARAILLATWLELRPRSVHGEHVAIETAHDDTMTAEVGDRLLTRVPSLTVARVEHTVPPADLPQIWLGSRSWIPVAAPGWPAPTRTLVRESTDWWPPFRGWVPGTADPRGSVGPGYYN